MSQAPPAPPAPAPDAPAATAADAPTGATTPAPAWRRRAAWGVSLLLVLLVGAFLVGEATGWPWLRQPLQSALQGWARVPVRLEGPFQLRLLGQPRLSVGHLHLGAPAGLGVPHLLEADGVRLQARWPDLWRWWRAGQPLRVQDLQARTLDLRLRRLIDGRRSWALGPERPATAEPAPPPQLGRLRIEQGRVLWDDALSDAVLHVLLSGGAADPGPRGAAQAAPILSYRAVVRGHWQRLPLDLGVGLRGALVLDDRAAQPLQPVQLRVEGTAGAAYLLFDGTVASLLAWRQLDGALRFSGPSLAAVGEPLGLTLPRSPAFRLQGQISHDAGVWRLQAREMTIGRSALAGDFRYEALTRPPRLSGQLRGQRLVLADLGPAVGTAGEGRGSGDAAPPPRVPGRVLPQRRFDLPSLHAMNADVDISIDRFDLGSAALEPLRQLKTRLLLQAGMLQLRQLRAGVAGGQIAGDTQLDGRAEAARWELSLDVKGMDIAGWVRALKTPEAAAPRPGAPRQGTALQRERRTALQGGAQPVRSYLTGVLDGSFRLRGQGRSTAQILGTLQGSAGLRLHEATLSHMVTEAMGIDLAQLLGVVVRGDAPLPLRCARLDLGVREGVAVVRRGVVDNADSTLLIDGQVDLRSERLALRARALPKDFSLLSLRAPLLVTGALARPDVGLDARALGPRAVAAAALTVLAAPLAALLPFIDPGQRPQGDPCAA